MIPKLENLEKTLEKLLTRMPAQGYEMEGLEEELRNLPKSYDAYYQFAQKLADTPMRQDWRYREPLLYEEIEAEMLPGRMDCLRPVEGESCKGRVRGAFLGSVQGCVLGKPLEVDPRYWELRAAGERCGQWPISQYISVEFLEALGRRHSSWTETVEGQICLVPPDDDLNYTVLGMLNLECYGRELTLDGVKRNWQRHICMDYVFGAERCVTAGIALDHLWEADDAVDEPPHPDSSYGWANRLNPSGELCGAAIRADAYGYAFPGRPDLAARYAYMDAVLTHRKTGIYAAMYLAAVIAGMFTAEYPLQPFEDAMGFLPQQSRFAEVCHICLDYVKLSNSFEEGYERLAQRFGDYGHCMLYQEVGTLMNTMKYATGIWQGVCLQVMQGNDTDSFGCTAGSMLGAYFGEEGLEQEKLEPFHDTIHIALADFYETSLSGLAERMSRLPDRVSQEIKEGKELGEIR